MVSRFERELRRASWPRSASELAARGFARGATRGRGWRRTSRGFFVPASAPTTAAQRVLDVAPLIPDEGALAGWAAAYVLGVDWFDGLDPWTSEQHPLTINLGRDLRRAGTPLVRYRREQLPASDRQVRHELAVTSPERTAFDGARWACDLTEAVVVLDMIGHVLGCDLARVHGRCRGPSPWAGIAQVRAALQYVDVRSASPWESRLRMFYVLQAMLPRPLVNYPLFTRDGRLLGVADLFDPEAGLVVEFDGEEHRKRRQHRADNLREEELEEVNLVVCRVDSLDFRFRRALAERLRQRYARGLARDRRLDGWTLEAPSWWRDRSA